MVNTYYRVTSGELGIYAAVDQDCPRDDRRREQKPDGSWLIKAGLKYPGAISLWTDKGMKKYINSGLLEWHLSVVEKPVFVHIANKPHQFVYQDELQIICDPALVEFSTKLPLTKFITQW